MMTLKNWTSATLSAVFFAFSVGSVSALSSLQDSFVETSKEEVAAIAPSIVTAYPHARFLTSGLSSPFGEWLFVRVEDASSCESELCPTIIIQKEIDWKILVMARKEIETSAGFEGGGYARFKLMSKGGSEIIVRYVSGEKTIYIAQ